MLLYLCLQTKTCEVHTQVKLLLRRLEASDESCNRKNFNLHYLCSLLNAQNFRKLSLNKRFPFSFYLKEIVCITLSMFWGMITKQ